MGVTQPTPDEVVVPGPGQLSRRECLRLLGEGTVGRVVFTDGALPAAEPVGYLLDGAEIVFHVEVGRGLAAAARQRILAVEVDEIDPVTRAGWVVLAVGQSYEITDPARRAQLTWRLRYPSAGTRDGYLVCVPVERLSGRRLEPVTGPLEPVAGP
jgi:nitroimidazol reductase NimA-like FMN-containing flavoprotein (pyridoxamine 5'-phosphate oxidase superfamily)